MITRVSRNACRLVDRCAPRDPVDVPGGAESVGVLMSSFMADSMVRKISLESVLEVWFLFPSNGS